MAGEGQGKICTVQGRYVDETLRGKDQERTLWRVTSAKKGHCVWATYKVLCTSWAEVTVHACMHVYNAPAEQQELRRFWPISA